jgi:hypothetical protein
VQFVTRAWSLCSPFATILSISFGLCSDLRHSAFSQPSKKGDLRLRTFVPGAVPRFGGAGKPQRIMESLRSRQGAGTAAPRFAR